MIAFGVLLMAFFVSFSNSSFTARITELMQVLKDLNQGKYERTMVSQQEKGKYACTQSHKFLLTWLGALTLIFPFNVLKEHKTFPWYLELEKSSIQITL